MAVTTGEGLVSPGQERIDEALANFPGLSKSFLQNGEKASRSEDSRMARVGTRTESANAINGGEDLLAALTEDRRADYEGSPVVCRSEWSSYGKSIRVTRILPEGNKPEDLSGAVYGVNLSGWKGGVTVAFDDGTMGLLSVTRTDCAPNAEDGADGDFDTACLLAVYDALDGIVNKEAEATRARAAFAAGSGATDALRV